MTRTFPPLMHCERCKKSVRVALRKTICSNGAEQVFIVCLEPPQESFGFDLPAEQHRVKINADYLPHEQIRQWGVDLAAIPVEADYTQRDCVVVGCTQKGTENQHWAPKEVFNHDHGSFKGRS